MPLPLGSSAITTKRLVVGVGLYTAATPESICSLRAQICPLWSPNLKVTAKKLPLLVGIADDSLVNVQPKKPVGELKIRVPVEGEKRINNLLELSKPSIQSPLQFPSRSLRTVVWAAEVNTTGVTDGGMVKLPL